jgi:hypothetical protein
MSRGTAGVIPRVAPTNRGRDTVSEPLGSRDMEYVRLGKAGLKVLRLCLGCMTYGSPEKGSHTWALDEEQSRLNSNKGTKCDIEIRAARTFAGGSRLQFMSRLAPPRLRLIRFPIGPSDRIWPTGKSHPFRLTFDFSDEKLRDSIGIRPPKLVD